MTADRPYWQSFLAPLLADSRLQIVLTGAGSSAFAGRALAPWLRQQTGRDVKAYGTTDIVANPYHYLDPSRPLLLVSFARSGNSPESVAAVALADQCVPACHHLLLVCNPDSQLCDWAAGKAHVCTQVMPEGTHDKSFAMTSSFSSMLLAGLLLLGPQDIAQTAAPLARMADECEQLLVRRQPQVKALAAGGYSRYIVVVGSCFTGLAEEAALKMLELTAGNVATRFDSSLGCGTGQNSWLTATRCYSSCFPPIPMPGNMTVTCGRSCGVTVWPACCARLAALAKRWKGWMLSTGKTTTPGSCSLICC
ncbi:hypothetical protein NVIRENTERO_04117 [Sodalis praecaptivus]|nr:hypothetical protein NVIRENTERO_04117 [Sodalis praecaptivus]